MLRRESRSAFLQRASRRGGRFDRSPEGAEREPYRCMFDAVKKPDARVSAAKCGSILLKRPATGSICQPSSHQLRPGLVHLTTT